MGAGASAVSSAASFESTLSGVKAVSGATNQQMQQLSGLALQLGKDTSFSASEAAAGIEELVKGGLSIPDIMNGAAKATLNLAAAGGVSLPDAATIAANALAEFNLKGNQMAHVSDLIAGAANASALDVSQFKFSLQAAGAVAATIGFSFDDLAVAIAEMGKAGITGSDAGTSLKTMMLNLTPSTKAATAEMQKLGIITKDGKNQFFDAAGHARSLAEVQQVLQNATKGMTDQQRLASLQVLFGSDAIRAAAVLAKEGAAGYREMAGAMGKVTAEGVGLEKLNNLAGDWQTLTGSIETLAITVGTAFLPALREATQWATSFVNSLIPLAETYGPVVVGVLQRVGAAVGDLIKSGGDVGVFADDIRESFGIDLTPFVVGIRAVESAVAAIAAGFQQGGIGGALAAILAQATALRATLIDWVATVGPQIATAVAGWGQSLWGWIAPQIPPMLAQLGQVATALVTWVSDQLPTLASALVGWVDAFVAWIGQAQAQAGPGILELAGHVAGRIVDAAAVLGTALLRWAGELVGWIAPMIPPLLAQLGKLAGAVWDWVADVAPTLPGRLVAWGRALYAWVAPAVAPLVAALGRLADRLWDWIVDTAPTLPGRLLAWGNALVDWVAPVVGPLLTALGRLASRVWDWVVETAPTLPAKLLAWGSALVDWVAPRVAPLVTALGEWAGRLWAWIVETAPTLPAKLKAWADALVDWIAPVVDPMLREAGKLATRLWTWITDDAAPAILKKLGEWGKAFSDWIGPAADQFVGTDWPKALDRFLTWIEDTAAPAIVTTLKTWVAAFVKWVGGEDGGEGTATGGLLGAVGRIAGVLVTFVTKTAEVLGPHLGKWVGAFVDWAITGEDSLLSKLPGALWTVATAMGNWIVKDAAPWLFEKVKVWGGKIIDGLIAGLATLGSSLATALANAIRSVRIDVGPFHLSGDGFRIDAPTMPSIALPGGGSTAMPRVVDVGGGFHDYVGPTRAGQTYLVGTGAQPELFTAPANGMAYPAGTYGGGPSTTQVRVAIDGREVVRATAKHDEWNRRKGVR